MFGWSRRQLFTGLVGVLGIGGLVSFALAYFIPSPPSDISIATGFKGGSAEFMGQRYKEILARSGVNVSVLLTDGSGEDLKLLKDLQSGVKVAVIQGGVSNSKEISGLLSLGRVNYQIFWVFYCGTDTVDDLVQLRGKRIAVGPDGSGTRTVAAKILGVSGVTSETATLSPLAGDKAVAAMNDGSLDVMFLANTDSAPLYKSMLRDPRYRVMNMRRAEALTRIFPFLVRVVLPQGVIDLERNIPATDVTTIATTNAILVRDDIHPAIVNVLTAALVEEHSEAGLLHRFGEFPMSSDPEFTMAEAALDFYKNGPSWLHRYLPLWATTHVQRALALLLTAVAIGLPLLNYGPKLYLWFVQVYVNNLYRRLRVVEAGLQTELTPPQVVAFQSDMENIERSASILPMRHSDLFFLLRDHIDRTRAHLASRLIEVHSQQAKGS